MGEEGGRIVIQGVNASGAVCFEEPLKHGWSPQRLMRSHGWRPAELRGFHTLPEHRIVLEYTVLPTAVQGHGGPHSSQQPGAGVHVHQRLAAYAVVHSSLGVLLTELSTRTSRAGLWVLPGGGVEPTEDPADAVVREVWEESGQAVRLGPLVDVSTSHRVGDFHGVMEDFHAVRMIFSAVCDAPGPLVVHDVGGSTGRAMWFTPEEILAVPQLARPGIAPWSLDAVQKELPRSS